MEHGEVRGETRPDGGRYGTNCPNPTEPDCTGTKRYSTPCTTMPTRCGPHATSAAGGHDCAIMNDKYETNLLDQDIAAVIIETVGELIREHGLACAEGALTFFELTHTTGFALTPKLALAGCLIYAGLGAITEG